MCIKHHTHCSMESVTERGTTVPSLSSMCETGRRVVEPWTTHVYWPGRRGRGYFSRCSQTGWIETPTDQYMIYNIKNGSKRLPLKTFSSPMNWPGTDSLDRPHLRTNCVDLTKDSYPGRTSVHVFVSSSTHLNPPPPSRGKSTESISHTKRNPTCSRVMD